MIYKYEHPELFSDWDKPDFEHLDRPVILWGAGRIGGVVAHCMKKRNVDYVAFCDIAADRWGTKFCGHKVISPEELKCCYSDAVVIITSVCYVDIWDTLQKMGIQTVYDCSSLLMEIDFSDFEFWTTREYAIRNVEQCLAGLWEQKKRAGSIDQIDLYITTKCSLRCRDCAVLIPYIQSPKNYDMTEILDDLTKVLDGLGHVRIVNFYGGEPMLHPHLVQMIRALRLESRFDRLSIITNGTIVPSEDLLQAMREEPRFMVRISDYGAISGKVQTIAELLKQYGIPYEITNYAYWDRGTKVERRNDTLEQLIKKFKSCTACSILHVHDRKGYLCCVASSGCSMGIFPVSPSNYIDLTDTEALPERLNHFITRPGRDEYLDACKYCSGIHCIQFEEKVPVAVQATGLMKFPPLAEQIDGRK